MAPILLWGGETEPKNYVSDQVCLVSIDRSLTSLWAVSVGKTVDCQWLECWVWHVTIVRLASIGQCVSKKGKQ